MCVYVLINCHSVKLTYCHSDLYSSIIFVMSGLLMGVPFTIPLTFVSASLHCLCLCSFAKWSTSSVNLSVVCGQLGFDISFLM